MVELCSYHFARWLVLVVKAHQNFLWFCLICLEGSCISLHKYSIANFISEPLSWKKSKLKKMTTKNIKRGWRHKNANKTTALLRLRSTVISLNVKPWLTVISYSDQTLKNKPVPTLGWSNGGSRSESGPLDGEGRTSSASQRSIPYTEVFISKSSAFRRSSSRTVQQYNCRSSYCWAILQRRLELPLLFFGSK